MDQIDASRLPVDSVILEALVKAVLEPNRQHTTVRRGWRMGADVNVSPVTMNVGINGLDNIGADVDLGLDDINLHVDKLEADVKAGLTLGEIKATLSSALSIGEIKAALATDMKADLQASLKELAPIIFSFLWKEIPLVRVSFPHRYRLGFEICGKQLLALTFCGESEVISERNVCAEKPQVAPSAGVLDALANALKKGVDHG